MASALHDHQQEEHGDDVLFEHHRFKADPRQSLTRIDKFLMDRLPNVSRNQVQNAIRNEFVRVNEKSVKPNYKVRPEDDISIVLPQPPRDNEIKPENIALDIYYEDEALLVINKPAGMVVHPAYNNWTGTLVNALVYHFQNLPEMQNPNGTINEGRPGLVHRLDKDTSGLMVVAKTEEAMNGLAKQFLNHSIERTYHAMIWGVPEYHEGTVDVHLGRSLKDRRVTTAFPEGDQGKHAVTHFQLLKDLRYVSLIQCQLETGRTHQIRAHMKYLGHPIFNDSTYGGNKILKGPQFSKYKAFITNCFKLIPRQALHAKSLGFKHPVSGKFLQFDSPLPSSFEELLNKWENYIKHVS